jgi:N-acetyl-anhydromuramyl-L-alanine amidase AmpD
MTMLETCARVEEELHALLPELGDDRALYFEASDAVAGKFYGYAYSRIGAIDPVTLRRLPDILAAPPRAKIGFAGGYVPADYIVRHERGHSVQELAARRGKVGFEQKLWALLGCVDTYAAHDLGSYGNHDAREWWAETFARVTDPIAPWPQNRPSTFGGRVPRYLDPQCLALYRELLKEAPQMIQTLSPNFSRGRQLPIRYIVLHTTEGTDSRGWLINPASRVSAHYLERDDAEYQLVDEDNTAWHAGRIVGTPVTSVYRGHIIGYDALGHAIWSVNPNDESIGIEAEGFASQPLSSATLARVVARIRDIRARRGPLPLVNHSELSPGDRSDPGAQNRAAIDAALGEEDVMKEEDFARIDSIVENKIVASEARVLKAVKDYNPLIQVARRVIRSVKGTPRDPGTSYPDDTTPIT